MTTLLETTKERERRERNEAIRSDFTQLRNQYPQAKKWRVVRQIADKYDLSPEAISYIVRDAVN